MTGDFILLSDVGDLRCHVVALFEGSQGEALKPPTESRVGVIWQPQESLQLIAAPINILTATLRGAPGAGTAQFRSVQAPDLPKP